MDMDNGVENDDSRGWAGQKRAKEKNGTTVIE